MTVEDVRLDGLRLIGDPVVDQLVAEYCGGERGAAGALLAALFRQSRMPVEHPLVARYLAAVPPVDLGDRRTLQRGQRLFELYGPEVLMTLGTYSLPLVYASGNGVQVVYRTRRLKTQALRRLCDTAQMVINCMEPAGLEDGGLGWWSTRKVRLIHALVRHEIRTDLHDPWPRGWGLPINQEDQAATLLTFSVAAIDGLRKMGAPVSEEDAAAYVYTWSSIGRLLGVDESVLALHERAATALAAQIARRQFRPTPEGRRLNDELLLAMDSLFPLRGYAFSLAHHFLSDSVFGGDVTALLQVPRPNWTSWLLRSRTARAQRLLPLLGAIPGFQRGRRELAVRFAQGMLLRIRPDGTVPFELPPRLVTAWRLDRG